MRLKRNMRKVKEDGEVHTSNWSSRRRYQREWNGDNI